MTGTYYYPWFEGMWLGDTVRRMDPPVLGQYDNTCYGEVVKRHFSQMKRHGIDFVSVSLEPKTPQYEHLMYASEEFDLPMTVLYESWQRASGKYIKITEDDHDEVVKDMVALAPDLEDRSWFKIDGRPVVMLYITRNYVKAESLIPRMREALGNVFLVGDEVFWDNRPSLDKLRLFDAVTSYNWYQPGRFSGTGKHACDSFLDNVRKELASSGVLSSGVPYWGVAMPGYNDLGIRPSEKHVPIPREDGYLFKETLKDARSVGETVMITSWNEWYEDTQIEPSRSYGDKYLKMIRS